MISSIVAPVFLWSQVTVSVQLPAAGLIQKDQLWNLVVVNNSNELLDAAVTLNLQDAVTGQLVLSGSTRNFLIGKGVKMLSYRDIYPVQYNYLAAELSANYIPLGSYIACYRVFKKEKLNGSLADECIRVNINPLSPPLLNTPVDKSELQISYPQFSWMPPSPLEMFTNLNYDISVVEILEGQSSSEAIQNNSPVYANSNIRNPFETYPASYSALVPGKNYAWQVTAKNAVDYSAQSEIWTFTVKQPDSTVVTVSTPAYISIGNSSSFPGVNYIKEKNLFIKYYSYEKERQADVKIFSADGKLMQEIKQKIIYGDNFMLFKLNRFFEEGKIYRLEITGLQGQKHTVQFCIKPTNQTN